MQVQAVGPTRWHVHSPAASGSVKRKCFHSVPVITSIAAGSLSCELRCPLIRGSHTISIISEQKQVYPLVKKISLQAKSGGLERCREGDAAGNRFASPDWITENNGDDSDASTRFTDGSSRGGPFASMSGSTEERAAGHKAKRRDISRPLPAVLILQYVYLLILTVFLLLQEP
jgi:hypothetical protein